MKNLKTLVRETQTLAKYIKTGMPKEVSQTWLWTAQNAFLTETDPSTGAKWKDRYGTAYGKGLRHTGNIEPYLSYKKLHRTGRLLRGLKVKRSAVGGGIAIELYNNVEYAEEHEMGKMTGVVTIKPPYVHNGAQSVLTGGQIHARPHMKPSKRVLYSPQSLVQSKMKSFGW